MAVNLTWRWRPTCSIVGGRRPIARLDVYNDSSVQGAVSAGGSSPVPLSFANMRRPTALIVLAIPAILIASSALFVMGVMWSALASSRVWDAHYDLVTSMQNGRGKSNSDRPLTLLADAKLNFRRSVRPLLKCPWRSDVRLYYGPGDQAWAWRDEDNVWFLKTP